MASPTRYALSYDFTAFQSGSPTSPLPADKLETEFNNLDTTTDEIINNLNLIQRSDGALLNGIVTYDSLNANMKALLGTTMVPKGDWAVTTNYEQLDLVAVGETTYIAVSDHTSSSSFTADLAAGKWLLWVNPGPTDGTSYFEKFSGDNSTTEFTVSQDLGTDENGLIVFVNIPGADTDPNWIPQIPTTDYTIDGTTLTFTTAPPNASNNIYVFAPAFLLAQASAYATAANASATAAASSASAAASSASAAATSATNAANSATAAAASASSAASSATAAASSATSAGSSATAAAASETNAAASASAASTSETNAGTSATAAAASATAAASSETNAGTSATAAAGSASAAGTSATTASTAATAATAAQTAAEAAQAAAEAAAGASSYIQTKTASEDISDFEICYLDGSGELALADASAAATGGGALRIANEAILNTASGEVLKPNATKTTTGLTAGAVYYLSETAGAITATPPSTPSSIIRVVGYAESTTVFHFLPDATYVVN